VCYRCGRGRLAAERHIDLNVQAIAKVPRRLKN
jgi:hypothetical protein